MKLKPTHKRSILSALVLIAMLAATLLDSSIAFAQDGAPEVTPTPTLEPTLTPTLTEEAVSPQSEESTEAPEQESVPTDTPVTLPTDAVTNTQVSPTEAVPTIAPDSAPTETSTQIPEGVSAESITETPAEAAEVVPLVMPEDTSNIIPGQYIVVYKKSKGDTATLKAGRDMVKKKGGQVKASYSSALKGFAAKLDKDALHELRTDPDIAYIEPDQYIHAVDDIVVPLDTQTLPSGNDLWGLDRIDQASLPLDHEYHYPSSAGSGVSVYVLDSGILTSHTQFEGRASNDYDLIGDNASQSDYCFHGTAVASVVGGKDYGVAKQATLHSVRVLKKDGTKCTGSFSDVIAGLNWVITNHCGPAVVNLSLGDDSVSSSLNSAVANTVAAGIPVVVAAGNGSANACNWSPASAPSAITVGGTNSSDQRDTSYSNYGSCLDLFAPGTSILCATNTGDSDSVYASGTSLASPMVAGAAALYLGDNPSATPAEVTAAILNYATANELNPETIGANSPNLLLAVFSNDVAQVTLSSPADAAETNQTTLTLAWNAGYIGNTYELQVDDSASFTDPLFYTTTTEGLSASVGGLTAGTWYWRVRAANTYGTIGEWSETRSFIVDLTPPAAPTLTSPVDGTYNVGTPAFAWGSVATAAYYQFEYSISIDPDAVISSASDFYRSGQLTATSTTPPSMKREQLFYWFARARDAAGNWSAWSSPRSIMIVPAGPSAPSLTSPTNGAAINDATPAFTWSVNSDPLVTYNIQISTSSTFDPITQEANDLTSATFTATHLNDGTYYWRVRGKSKYGIYGSWSAVRNFDLDTVRPAAPTLINPISGTVVNEVPVFSWSTSTDWTAYQFAYSLSDNLAETESEDYVYASDILTGNSITPTVKNTNVIYYWNVRARDAAGNWSFWSEASYLTIQAGKPGQATLADPVSGKLTNNDTPTLSWKLLADCAYYQIQIASSTAFSNLLVNVDGLTGTSYTVEEADKLASGTYYWRVRGRNNTSDYGPWSSYRYFKVDVDEPAAPTLLYPANEASVIGTPTFKWSVPSGAKYYQFRYADSDAPDTYIYTSGEITKYYLKPPAMDSMQTYLWSVRARDAAGNWSGWSTPFSVTILPPVPGKPVQTSPSSGAMVNPDQTSLELTWTAAANAVSYHVQVSTSTSFVSPYLLRDETDWEDLKYDPELSNEGTYYWRVRAENANGVYGSWSSTRYFRIDKTKPAAPALYYPKNNTQVTGTPAFQWIRTGDAATFEFQYNTSNSTDTYVYRSGVINGTSIRPPTMTTGILYYWFVRAYDKAGNQSDWSAAYTVTILPPKPSVVPLSLPINGKVVADLRPEFSWSAVNYADTYDFQASTNSSFTAIVASSSGKSELSFTPTTDLPQGRVYWRVRARNENDIAGAWSTIRYVMVDTLAPSAPLLRTPADNASVTGWPTLTWYAASGARYYQLAYNTMDDPDTAIYISDWTTATSLKVTGMDLNTTFYWFVHSRDTAGNISDEWSTSRRVTIRPATPARVALASPSSGYATDDATLDLAWNAVTYGHTYKIEVDTSTYFNSANKHSYTSDVEATSYITAALDPGKWYWRVRACNENDSCGSWSTARSIVLYPYFDTQFASDGDTEGWQDSSGASWAASSGSLTTAGLTGGKSSSAAYADQTFTDFTYEATMQMDAPASDEANSFGLVLRGSPYFDAWNDWARGVYFVVRQVNDSASGEQYACALAYKIVAGAWGYLGGSCGEAVYGDWNSLKVYARGTTWKFYINDYLILSTSVSSITSGRLGVVSWGQSAADTFVDEAAAGRPVVPTALTLSLSAQSVKAIDVDPEQVFEEMKK